MSVYLSGPEYKNLFGPEESPNDVHLQKLPKALKALDADS